MDWTSASANWSSLTDAIVTRWPSLARNDVLAVDGDRAGFNALLGKAIGLTAREADEQIEEFLQGPMPSDAIMDPAQDNVRIKESAAHIPAGEDVYSEDGDFGDEGLSERPMGRVS